MADITKRSGSDDCEDGERGERGERGKRGHRGHRGPGGPATSLVGPTEGDGSLIAGEDIPIGSVIAPGSALLALAATEGSTLGPRGNAIGIASKSASAGQVVEYVSAGPLTLDTSVWDARTGGAGGLVPNAVYYLSQTTLGHMTTVQPIDGQIVRIGVAFDTATLNLAILQLDATVKTDRFTIAGNGSGQYPFVSPLSVHAYGFTNFGRFSTESWVVAPPATLPGTPMFKNLNFFGLAPGQSPADAAVWLSSHVIGLSLGSALSPAPFIPEAMFISGGLIELTEAQWNAVWTASDPNRGVGSGLLPGRPYYLSDVPGTFFLINTTGAPPVGTGNWITKCFVALSPTVALIQISDPRQVASPSPGSAEFPVLSPVFVGTNFVAVPGFVNQVDCNGAGRTASLPAAASVPNGTFVGIKKSSRLDVSAVSLSTVLASDTIDGAPGQGGGFLSSFLDDTASSVVLVSDGVSNWTILAGGNDNGF